MFPLPYISWQPNFELTPGMPCCIFTSNSFRDWKCVFWASRWNWFERVIYYIEVLQKKGTTYRLAQIQNLKGLRIPHPHVPNVYDHDWRRWPVLLSIPRALSEQFCLHKPGMGTKVCNFSVIWDALRNFRLLSNSIFGIRGTWK